MIVGESAGEDALGMVSSCAVSISERGSWLVDVEP